MPIQGFKEAVSGVLRRTCDTNRCCLRVMIVVAVPSRPIAPPYLLRTPQPPQPDLLAPNYYCQNYCHKLRKWLRAIRLCSCCQGSRYLAVEAPTSAAGCLLQTSCCTQNLPPTISSNNAIWQEEGKCCEQQPCKHLERVVAVVQVLVTLVALVLDTNHDQRHGGEEELRAAQCRVQDAVISEH